MHTRITIVVYVSLLKEWLNIHPYKNNREAYLWLSEATKINEDMIKEVSELNFSRSDEKSNHIYNLEKVD